MSSQLTPTHQYPQPAPSSFPAIQPRLISRRDAAAYLGIGATTFDRLVAMETMPKPIAIGKRRVWDLRQIDAAIDELPEAELPSQTTQAADPYEDVHA
jgi:predicted DNA-binding transcriptional regulator AlpA